MDRLFPMSPLERIDAVEHFVHVEKTHREHMVERHPDQQEYWHSRVADAQSALDHLDALRGAFGIIVKEGEA